MKRFVSFVALLLISVLTMSQSTLPLRADTVVIEKVGGSAELKIKNRTRDSLGVMINLGAGRTEFRRAKVLNDSTVIIGLDTLQIKGGAGGGGGIGSVQTQYSVTGDGTSGNKVQLVNDEPTPNKWEFYGTNIKDSIRSFREIEENFYGTIYEKTSWANLNDFSNNGGTFTTNSGRIQGSGGAGTFTQSLDLLQFTNLQRWVIDAGVRIDEKTGSSFGMGFGIRSYNSFGLSNALARFVASTGTGTGTAIINGSTNNAQLAQTSAITFSALDSVSIVIERNVNILSVTIRNITTNSAEQTTSYTYTYNSAPYLPNTGRFAIFSFGGQFSIFRLKISSKEVKNARLMGIGDSKMEGYNASIGSLTWGAILNNYFKTTVKHAGGFDRTIDVSRGIPEILALRPQQVILSIGSNDIRTGVDSTTLCNRYDSCVTAMLNAGIDVYHAVLYETSISMLPLVNHINLVYSPDKVINTYDATKQPGAVDADNVHLTDLGHRIAANTVVQSFKLYGGNERYGASTSGQVVASGTVNVLSKFTATNSLGNSQVSEVPGRVSSTNANIEVITSGSPGFSLHKTTNGTNEKITNFFTDGNDSKIALTDDARSINQTVVMQWNRTGMTLNRVFFPNGNVGIGESNPLVKLKVTGTDAIGFPSGTTAQRPTGVAGYLRWNTDSVRFEGYDGTKWVSLLPGSAISGSSSITSTRIPFGDPSNAQTTSPNFRYIDSSNSALSGKFIASSLVRSGDSSFTNKPTKRAFFFGNSITAGSTTPLYLKPSTRISNALNLIEVNYGIGGTRMVQITPGDSAMEERRFLIPTFDGNTMDLLAFGYGTNDWRNTSVDSATFRAEYNETLDTAILLRGWPASKILIITAGFSGISNPTTQLRNKQFVDITKDLARKKGVKYSDSYAAMESIGLRTGLQIVNGDSVHLNEQGTAVWARAALDSLGSKSGDIRANGHLYAQQLHQKSYQYGATQSAVDTANRLWYEVKGDGGGDAFSANLAIGPNAMDSLTTGKNNLYFGSRTGISVTTGSFNTGAGYNSLGSNKTGNYNTAYGHGAAVKVTGNNNTALGAWAMQNSEADDIVAIGYQALRINSTGIRNVAIGSSALFSSQTSSNNVAIGYQSQYQNTTGGGNVAIGFSSLFWKHFRNW